MMESGVLVPEDEAAVDDFARYLAHTDNIEFSADAEKHPELADLKRFWEWYTALAPEDAIPMDELARRWANQIGKSVTVEWNKGHMHHQAIMITAPVQLRRDEVLTEAQKSDPLSSSAE